MREIIKCLFKVMISVLLSFILLSGFVRIYSFSGIHITNQTHATDYTWEPRQLKANMTEGFSWLSMDSNGFNNVEPIKSMIDVLVIGSSHMEAVNVPADKNTVSLLNATFADMYFYNIGMSGHKIYNVVNNIQDAIGFFKPMRYVIIETSIVNLDEDMMRQVLSGEFIRIKSYDSGLVYQLQKKAPLIKALYKAIEDWRTPEALNNEPRVDTDTYNETLNAFLKKAKTACGNQVQLIICYQPATELDDQGSMICATDPDSLILFARACEDNDIVFIDMTDDFQEAFLDQSIIPHGFINTAVGAGHLNEAGHKMIAERLATTIRVLETEKNK